MSNNYFVGIDDPDQLRRDVLTSGKKTAQLLKKQYELKAIRKEKATLIKNLNQVMLDMKAELAELQKALPQRKEEDLPASLKKKKEMKKKAPVKKKKVKVTEKKPEPKPLSEVDILEQKLADIEKKLNKL